MSDFEFLKNPASGRWVISAPRRAKRTNVEKAAPVCPFCPGQEIEEEELYRIQNTQNTQKTSDSDNLNIGQSDTSVNLSFPSFPEDNDWLIRVVKNKFPFAPHHEVIIHSPDHHKNFDELPLFQVELILQTYRQRYNHNKEQAVLPVGSQVYIFNNSGSASGASLTHPHTQLVVIPESVKLDITPLDMGIYSSENSTYQNTQNTQNSGDSEDQIIRRSDNSDLPSVPSILNTDYFYISCPATSEWPDEVWIAPKQNGEGFGSITDKEIKDMSFALSRLIQIMDLRHGSEFPFNFYIHPGENWYLRLIPRTKILGGFELGTNIIVNTQNPAETFAFIQEHFWEPDSEKIKNEHQADYLKKV